MRSELDAQRCENYKALLLGDSKDKPERILVYARCKQWTCSHCAKINRKQWNARIIAGINLLGTEWSFITITAHRNATSEFTSLKNLRVTFDKLRKRLKRKFPNLEYARVFEQHKDKRWHIHMIANITFDDVHIVTRDDGSQYHRSDVLIQMIVECGGGYIADCKPLRVDEDHHAGYVAYYVSKYMTKMEKSAAGELGRVRRIQTTKGFPKRVKPDQSYAWEVRDFLYEKDVRIGKPILDLSIDRIIPLSYFDIRTFYPIQFDEMMDDRPIV